MTNLFDLNTPMLELPEWMSTQDNNLPIFFLQGITSPMQLALSHSEHEGTVSVTLMWVECLDYGGHVERLEADGVKDAVSEILDGDLILIAVKDEIGQKAVAVLSELSGMEVYRHTTEEEVWQSDNPFAVAVDVNGLDTNVTVGEVYEKIKKPLSVMSTLLNPESKNYVLSAVADDSL